MGTGYPPEINKIIMGKCATPGCHTQQSKDAAAGLAMETWDQLFEGDRNGAVCIPFRHEYSTIFLFTNTYPALGAINTPTMPYNKPPLSEAEMTTLINWIDAGAPNSNGKIAFADNANRSKVYVTNQACDVVTVFDAKTQLQMRYVDVGVIAGGSAESPHMIKISPDGKYWYVVFSASSSVMQKFRTSDDSYAGQIPLGSGSWNTLIISSDSKYAFAADWRNTGKIAYVDLENMNLIASWNGFNDPHGTALNSTNDTLYVTSTSGNFIYKIPVLDPSSFDQISLVPPQIPGGSALYEPHQILFSPDSLYYYVSCPKKNEIRVMRTSDDGLQTVISTGAYPLEMSLSKTQAYLFVTCESDLTAPETNRGSVTIINYVTNTWVANLRANMSEPHGVAVDDANGLVYVGNRNISGGTIPHHTSNCGGTNGYISFIDLNTLKVIPDKKIEVAVDPYSISIRP